MIIGTTVWLNTTFLTYSSSVTPYHYYWHHKQDLEPLYSKCCSEKRLLSTVWFNITLPQALQFLVHKFQFNANLSGHQKAAHAIDSVLHFQINPIKSPKHSSVKIFWIRIYPNNSEFQDCEFQNPNQFCRSFFFHFQICS